jgi:hypothetical protein
MFFSFLKRKPKKDTSKIKNAVPRRSFSRRMFFVILPLLILLIVVSVQPTFAQSAPKIPSAAIKVGQTALGAAGGLFALAVTPVLQVITFFCALFVDLAAHFLGFMLRPDLYNFTTEPMIVTGWKMVRDLCNLFFLLILLFIAFCTILQIEKYHLKKNLLTLVIMALLINFSKPIAIFIFDGAQLMMNYFLGAMGSYENTITALSNVADVVYKDLPGFFSTLSSSVAGGGGFSSTAVQYIFAIIFMFMYAIALFVMAVYLLIRIVALWILIIVSPFAFLASIVPDFKKMSNDWWDALFKYSFVGPVMAFFLWLSTKLGSSFFISMAAKQKSGGTVLEMGTLVSFMTVIVFLYASIMMAQKFGIQFASAVTSTANKALAYGTGLNAAKWTGRKAWQGTKWGAKKAGSWADREILAKRGLSPKAWKGAWDKRTKEREEDVYGDAEAKASDVLSKHFKSGKKPPEFYKRRREAEKKAKYKKEQDSMGTAPEIALKAMKELYYEKGMDPQEKSMRAMAYLETLTASRDFNEAIKQAPLDFIFGENAVMDAGDAPQNVRKIMSAFGMTDEADQNYYAKRLGEIGMANRDSHLWDMDNTDPVSRNENLFGKVGTIDGQVFQIGMHSEAIFKKNNKGEIMGLSGTADPFLRRLAICGYDYAPRMREQVKSDFIKEESIKFMLDDHDRLTAEAAKYSAAAASATDPENAAALREKAAEAETAAQDRYTFLESMAKFSSKNNAVANIAKVNAIAASLGSKFKIEKTKDEKPPEK